MKKKLSRTLSALKFTLFILSTHLKQPVAQVLLTNFVFTGSVIKEEKSRLMTKSHLFRHQNSTLNTQRLIRHLKGSIKRKGSSLIMNVNKFSPS